MWSKQCMSLPSQEQPQTLKAYKSKSLLLCDRGGKLSTATSQIILVNFGYEREGCLKNSPGYFGRKLAIMWPVCHNESFTSLCVNEALFSVP